jgi:hypothetical protein
VNVKRPNSEVRGQKGNQETKIRVERLKGRPRGHREVKRKCWGERPKQE